MKISNDWILAEATQIVCRMLTDAGHQALFVGGCVRNALLGVPVSDIDIATDATPDKVMDLAKAGGFKSVPTGIDHGTVTVLVDNTPFEITTFRKDVETDGRRAVVAFADNVKDDALRRDFTMNALYAKPDGTVIDPLNGLPDLKARRFRFIEDAEQRIREDYLRILRFFRFQAWYGDAEQGFEPDTLSAIAQNIDGLKSLSRERVGSEIVKLLAAPDPVMSISAMRSTGVLPVILPGADDQALGPLVHLESERTIVPNAMRRLSVLGGTDVAEGLRLSKAQIKEWTLLRQLTGSVMPAAELGYRYGIEIGQDALLLRAAVLQAPIAHDAIKEVARGAVAKVPLGASDLQPEFEGALLGQALKKAENAWIDSDFSLSKDALLTMLTSK